MSQQPPARKTPPLTDKKIRLQPALIELMRAIAWKMGASESEMTRGALWGWCLDVAQKFGGVDKILGEYKNRENVKDN